MAVIDLNVTSTCNLACTYCSEGFECGLSTSYDENTSLTFEDVKQLIAKISDPKKEIYFWGGEPFVNYSLCRSIMEHYTDDKNISFFFYTNGVYLKKYLMDLIQFNTTLGPNRLHIQVSYDGKAIHDITRPDKKGNASTDIVKNNYLLARDAGISISLKSVITADNFHRVYDAFLDVITMDKNYHPTPDLYSQLSEQDFGFRLEELKAGITKIAKYIYANNLPPETFGWFRKSRALCQAGVDYISVDLNGDISPCHGCMYKESHTHVMGNVFKTDDIDLLIKQKSAQYSAARSNQPLGCQTCDSMFCMKCNAATFEKSSKEDYWDKWTDHRSNWQVCTVFKMNEVVHYALRKAIDARGRS